MGFWNKKVENDYDAAFDFNHDGKLDFFERCMQIEEFEQFEREMEKAEKCWDDEDDDDFDEDDF